MLSLKSIKGKVLEAYALMILLYLSVYKLGTVNIWIKPYVIHNGKVEIKK